MSKQPAPTAKSALLTRKLPVFPKRIASSSPAADEEVPPPKKTKAGTAKTTKTTKGKQPAVEPTAGPSAGPSSGPPAQPSAGPSVPPAVRPSVPSSPLAAPTLTLGVHPPDGPPPLPRAQSSTAPTTSRRVVDTPNFFTQLESCATLLTGALPELKVVLAENSRLKQELSECRKDLDKALRRVKGWEHHHMAAIGLVDAQSSAAGRRGFYSREESVPRAGEGKKRSANGRNLSLEEEEDREVSGLDEGDEESDEGDEEGADDA